MSIPHRVRAVAREAYRHAIMTGRYEVQIGIYYAWVYDDMVQVIHDSTAVEYEVPVAASWL